MEEDEVMLNVGGTIFVTFWGTLKKYPNTKLGSLNEDSPHYRQDRDVYFFDRNPELFNTILDFYRNDILHLPNHLCSGLWHQELRYWGIPISSTVSECCYSTYVKYFKDDYIIQNLRKAFGEESRTDIAILDKNNVNTSTEYITYESVPAFRVRVWNFLSEPRSSKKAKIYNGFYFSMVFMSAIYTIMFTLPGLRTGDPIYGSEYNKSELVKMLNLDANNSKQVQLETTDTADWLKSLDIFLALFFSVELFVRIGFCPDKIRFFKDWLNVLDVCLFISIVIRFVLNTKPVWFLHHPEIFTLSKISIWMLILRIFRFLRLAKQFSGLYVLLLSLRASFKELLLLFFTIVMFAMLFASCIFYAEFSEPTTFPTMLYGLWWAIITLTTVGYGDHVPKSAVGQVIGSLCAICGIIVLAMPVAMIVANFNEYYRKKKDREHFIQLKNSERRHKSVTV